LKQRGRYERGSWVRDRWPVIRFVLLFGLVIGIFHVLAATSFAEERAWPAYLRVNAQVSGGLLRMMGQEAVVDDRVLSGPGCSLLIERGCDAVHPSVLFIAAVLASPVLLWTKWPGILIGTFALMAINLVRIVSLFFIQRHVPSVFELMHVEVWQALFIFLAVLFWAIWAVWARKRSAKAADATA
jgi:exosortase/archaeosortase family protein